MNIKILLTNTHDEKKNYYYLQTTVSLNKEAFIAYLLSLTY